MHATGSGSTICTGNLDNLWDNFNVGGFVWITLHCISTKANFWSNIFDIFTPRDWKDPCKMRVEPCWTEPPKWSFTPWFDISFRESLISEVIGCWLRYEFEDYVRKILLNWMKLAGNELTLFLVFVLLNPVLFFNRGNFPTNNLIRSMSILCLVF